MQPGTAIPSPLLDNWQQSILKACGGRDGGAPGDKFLTNPLQCTISPRQLACKNGDSGDSCLSATQLGALEKIYGGTRNPRTGELIYFGDVLGSETQLMAVYGDTPLSRDFSITHWTLPPARSSASFDFDADMKAMDDGLAVEVNAMDPDLSRFAARGGKLIIHHGWADGLITATDSLDYYQRVFASGRDKSSFARLFMAPGMGHCAGGGVGFYGQAVELPVDKDATPETDLLQALDRWSETGEAPDVIYGRQSLLPVPAKPGEEGKRIGERPICAFPKMARYDGKGNPDAATSFSCVKAPAPKYERPAATYLR